MQLPAAEQRTCADKQHTKNVPVMHTPLYFTGWMVQRYVVLYVYERSYESGGIIFPFIFDRMLACLHVMIWLTGSVLLTNEAYWQVRWGTGAQGPCASLGWVCQG